MSCCNCVSIRVGSEYLDLPPDFSLPVFRRREQITDGGITSLAQALESTVPLTPKNRRIAADLLNPSRLTPSYVPVECVVVEAGKVLEFDRIQFTQASDPGTNLSFRLFSRESHWILKAEALQLREIPFGSYTFTQAFVTNNQANDAQYADGDLGVYFPLVNYGRFFRGEETRYQATLDDLNLTIQELDYSTVITEDYRPFLHLLSVLQKGFKEIGWSFRSPLLETNTGRRLICYLLRKDLGQTEEDLQEIKFEATVPEDPGETQVFNEEVFDNGDNFSGGSFSGVGIHDLHLRIRGGRSRFDEFNYKVTKYNFDGTVAEILLDETFDEVLIDIERTMTDVSILPGQYVIAEYDNGDGVSVIAQARFYNTPKRKFITKGDEVNLQDILGDYNFLEIVKGYAHIINAKIHTDKLTREVWFYSPRDVEFYSEAVDGFFTSTLDDWTSIVIPDSAEFDVQRQDVSRYQKFCWKESGDAAIDALPLDRDEEYLARVIDLGSEYPGGEPDEIRNPFFEPTVNQQLDITFPNYLTDGSTDLQPYCPFMLDNQDGNFSWDIGPRLLYAEGPTSQKNADESKTSYMRFENTIVVQAIPYAYMVPNNEVYLAGGSQPEKRIAYGTYEDLDLYDLFYKEAFLSSLLVLATSVGIEYSLNSFYAENFRNLKRVNYGGQTFVAELLELPNRESCSDAPIQALLQPRPFLGDIGGGNVVVEGCSNQPRISVSYDFDAGTITATADNGAIGSTIDTDTWEYSTDEGSSFTAYTPGTALSESSVVFKRVVTFTDGCDQKTVTRIADLTGLCSNQPGIQVTYDVDTDELTATRSGSFNSTIDTDSLFVNVDGDGEVSYTEGTPISDFTTAVFRRAVTFTNACPDVEVTSSFDLDEEECVNRPEIVFTELVTGLYKISIGGTSASAIRYSDIQVSDDGGTTWKVWDRSPLPPKGTFKVRAIIHYADGCPLKIIEADCPT